MSMIRDIIRRRDSECGREAAGLAADALRSLRKAGMSCWLFGSLARGEFRQHSDIDILIDAKGPERDRALRLCLSALRGHASSIVFVGDLPPHALPHILGEAADGPCIRGH